MGCWEQPIEYLSRNDFDGTWKNTAEISRAAIASNFPGGTSNTTPGRNFNFEDNQIDEELREQGKNNGLVFADFRNAAWDDQRWEDVLDQVTIKDLQTLVDQGSFKTAKIDRNQKEGTVDYDGPALLSTLVQVTQAKSSSLLLGISKSD